MANIPLSQIPNAPQAVFTPTANPQFRGDVVGDQAKAEIRQGYQASMVNPEAAGALGRSVAALGQGVARGIEGVSNGMILADAADRREKEQQASRSGIIKFYQNEAAIQNNHARFMKDQPPSMAGPAWLKAAGANGEKFFEGMDPYERYAMTPQAMHSFYTGTVSAVHAGRAAYTQDQEAEGHIQFTSLYNQQRWHEADTVNEAQWKLRQVTEPQYLANKQAIQVGQQKQGLSQKIAESLAGDGSFAQQVADAAQEEKPLEGFDQLSPKLLDNAVRVGSYLNGRRMDAAQDNVLNRIDTGTVSSPEQLKGLPEWGQMDKQRQDALITKLNYNKAGTPAGELDFKNAKQLVDNYPPTGDSNNVKDYWDARNFIIANVADGGQSKALLGELDKRMSEMASNAGQLKPHTQVNQWLSQSLTQMLKNNSFGQYDGNLKDGSPEQLKKNLSALNVKEDIYEAVLAKNPKSRVEAQKILDTMTRQYRAGGSSASPSSSPTPKKSWWSNFSVSNDTIDFIKQQEGFTRTAYTDSDKDTGSIGYGTRLKPGEKTITEQEATQRLSQELSTHEQNVNKAASTVGLNLTPAQRTALISFDFNTGAGAKVIQETGGDIKSLASKMAEYKYATVKGEKKALLVNRRNAEIALLNS